MFEIGKPQHEAAQLLADGELTTGAIAERVGVVRETLYQWRQRPEFIKLVDDYRARFAEEVLRRGLADRMRRVKAQNDRWNRMQRIIEARADAPEMAGVPGGSTGMLVRTVKQIGSGEAAREVEEFTFDAALVKEIREHEKMAAQELGQWIDRQEIGGSTEKPVVVKVLRGVSMDDL